MGGEDPAALHPDLVIAQLASAQHAVVSRTQLLARGVTDRQIDRRLATRRLYRLHDGVHARVPHPGQRGLFMAAVLACCDGALVSHRSALALWDLREQASGPVHVTIPRGGSRARAGVQIHTTRGLHPDDVTALDDIPCTSWARTLVDCAGSDRPAALRRALERAQILRLFDSLELEEALARARGKRGIGKLRRVLAQLVDDPPPTRSELERRFLDLIERAGLPRPITNAVVAGHEVDFHWPAQRLVVETDGRTTHDTPLAFERDRARDLDLALAGWQVMRITWRQLRDDPERVAAWLRAALLPG